MYTIPINKKIGNIPAPNTIVASGILMHGNAIKKIKTATKTHAMIMYSVAVGTPLLSSESVIHDQFVGFA